MAKYPIGLATRFKSHKRRKVSHRRKARGLFHPMFLRGTHKRRRGAHRPVVIWTGSKFRRPKRSRLFPHPTRINPRRRAHRRSYRHNPRRSYRRNPLRLPMGIDRSVMAGLPVAGGIALSMFAMPQIAKYMPASMQQYSKFFGAAHILLGVVAMAFVKKDIVRTLGGTMVAMGLYDLIASNVPQLNLPQLPRGVVVHEATGADEIVGSNFEPVAIGSSYGSSYGDDIDYGGDEIEIG